MPNVWYTYIQEYTYKNIFYAEIQHLDVLITQQILYNFS